LKTHCIFKGLEQLSISIADELGRELQSDGKKVVNAGLEGKPTWKGRC